jgi:phage recombination protein Bet
MSTETTALTVHQPADLAPADFGEEHKRIVRDAFAAGATPIEFEMLWLGAKSRGLDPVRKQIHFVQRYDKARNCKVWSSQVSIDGFRAIAEDTGKYDGQDEPIYELDPNGGVLSVKVAVYRKDIGRPFWGHARWAEFVQMGDKGPTFMWGKMPFHMLAKCAEALALRKAFPEKLAGLYTPDEMPPEDRDEPGPRTVNLTSREIDGTPPRDDGHSPPPALSVAQMPHVHVDGDATFAVAPAPTLLGLLAAAREEGHGPVCI